MSDLQILNLVQRVFLEVLKLSLPVLVEILEMLVSNRDILLHLSGLNVSSQLILVLDNISLHHTDLLHQVFIELVLVHFTALFSKQLHLLFDDGEHEDLLILIQDSITALIEDLNELNRC